MYIFFTFLNYCVLYIVLHMYVIIHKHVHVQYPSDKRYKAFCVSNAFKRGAKRVYYKRKMRVNVALHVTRGVKRIYSRDAKRVCWKRVLRETRLG